MPFTASHPAIILPLLQRRVFSVSGLLMGSMVPDFEFFIRLEPQGVHGHSYLAMFWLNLPLALLCITLYHVIVRDQLILHLPSYFKKRFQPFLIFDWVSYFKSNYLKVIYSILVGNISHLFWDAFTHSDGFFVTLMPFLYNEFWQIPLYHLLQYGFSVLGLITILNFIATMPGYKLRGKSSIKNIVGYWCVVSITTMIIYFLRYDVEDYKDFGARVVFICAGFMLGLIVASVGYNLALSKSSLDLINRYQTKKL
jgi:hypothetical protein